MRLTSPSRSESARSMWSAEARPAFLGRGMPRPPYCQRSTHRKSGNVCPLLARSSVQTCKLLVLLGNREIHHGRFARLYRYFLRPGLAACCNRPLHFHLRAHIQHFRFGLHLPSLVPRHDLVFARRNVGELKRSVIVGDGIIRMLHDEHVRVHPHVPGVAFQFHHAVVRSSSLG